MAILHNSYFNKGPAFSEEERTTFKLHGLLPPNEQTLDEQVQRAYEQYSSHKDDLAKNTFMATVKAQDEVLYYKVAQSNCILSTKNFFTNCLLYWGLTAPANTS